METVDIDGLIGRARELAALAQEATPGPWGKSPLTDWSCVPRYAVIFHDGNVLSATKPGSRSSVRPAAAFLTLSHAVCRR